MYIANSYGRYTISKEHYELFDKNNQFFMKYVKQNDDMDSYENVAGVCNEDRTVFGMMPHPERNNTGFYNILYKILTQSNLNKTKVKSDFDIFEESINNLMTSEHISYKSTKKYLKELHTQENWVVQGPGENAGIVDIGNGYCIALRIESHNHPTFINAFEGAATGVGGIMRDIFTMGARPIAILDFLRFGVDSNSDRLLKDAISGISYYGNCVGVPNVGGDLYRDERYNKNPLVNVGCVGIVKKENIIYGNAKDKNTFLVYIGSKTGNEVINGAAMASKSFDKEVNIKEMDKNVQRADPFLEKLLLEACCEIAEQNLADGMQDLVAGGLLCASYQ
jgi:phosphoribosylformylglycinamidine synthase